MAADSSDWIDLMFHCRWVVLGTTDDEGCPYLSKVAVVPVVSDSVTGFIMHLSDLAMHTKFMTSRPQVGLLFSEPDQSASVDPQTLARFSISGEVEKIDLNSSTFQKLAKDYIDRFPDAEMRFGFGDFHLFAVQPTKGNYVGGFGRASTIDSKQIAEAITDRLSPQ